MSEKTYAFIKNSSVVNAVIFDNPTQELLNIFIAENDLDLVVEANNKTIIGGTYDGSKFWAPQPYPSWIKNEELNEWEAPIPYPGLNDVSDEGNLKDYEWNEEILNWEEIQVSE